MTNETIFFAGFAVFIFLMLAFDLGVFNKKDHIIKYKEALVMSLIWVCMALGFYILLNTHGELIHGITSYDKIVELTTQYKHNIELIPNNFEASLEIYKSNLALEFITGYLIEYALSVDNIFVIVLIFTAFGVRERYYHRVLFWGIIGAVLMRFLFIFLGATLIREFEWILYLFGAFLIYTGIMMFVKRNEDEKIEPENHPVVKFSSKFFNVFPKYVGKNFIVRKRGKNMITPLFIVLIVIEFTDLIFAVDSIPAIFAISNDPFILYTSNIFAILWLIALFCLLDNFIHLFNKLPYGLAVILSFIGVKMIISPFYHIESVFSLMVIGGVLLISVILSSGLIKGKL